MVTTYTKLVKKLTAMTEKELKENMLNIESKLNSLNENLLDNDLAYNKYRTLVREYNMSSRILRKKVNTHIEDIDWD